MQRTEKSQQQTKHASNSTASQHTTRRHQVSGQ